MKVLVTGATGFLGRALIPELRLRHEVLCGRRADAAAIDGARNVYLDFTGPGRTGSVLSERVDAIIHLAQSRRYRDFPDAALDVFDVNLNSTARLLDYATRNGVKWFFLASTGSVYEPYLGPLREEAPVAPKTYYSRTKLAAEHLVLSYASFLDVSVFRLFFPYGAGQTDRLMPTLIEKIDKDAPILLDGNTGGMQFTPTHVSDVARLICRGLEDRWTGIMNVASPDAVTIRDVAQVIGRLMGRAPRFEPTGSLDAPVVVPDLQRLRTVYPAMGFTPLDVGLEFITACRARH